MKQTKKKIVSPILEARTALSMSRAEFARRMKVSYSTAFRVERGLVRPLQATASRAAKVLRKSVDTLFPPSK